MALERGLSENTCSAYAGDIEQYLQYCDKKKTDPLLAEIPFVEEYLWSIKTQKKLSPASLFRKGEAMRAFYKFLRLDGKIKNNPTSNLKSPHLPRKLPHYLTLSEMEKLLNFPSGSAFSSIRTSAAIELLYATGMRISELITLRLESINFQQGWLRVFGKGSKERMIPVSKRALEMLKNYLDARSMKFGGKNAEYNLFLNKSGKKISRIQLWKDIIARGREAGVEIHPHPHLFRHTFASHLVQGGADLRSVQEMLGHADISTTQIYINVNQEQIREEKRLIR